MEAVAIATSLPISTKQSVEICSFIRGKTTEKSRKLLEQVMEQKIAIPYRRFNKGVGHKKGKIASGRYPLKATSAILKLIGTAEANAEVKGMSAPFQISEVIASQSSRNWHYGRQRRRKTKRTHIKMILKSLEKKAKEKPKTEAKKVETKKTETKEVTKK
ncbi:MAG: 50S ribosomal protein L22 [Nanoarchaeota archaeon]|jgi:large subunit ribosomal protein L22|nr:50S ribosomal protein L22 [Nanoarchaeota archaeon]|tara:strand:- start:29344 stop:29823 length:480 start_codon:yes stop_codon:yes gene_type:complete